MRVRELALLTGVVVVVALAAGCGGTRRTTPPPGLERTAVPVGATAPEIALRGAQGAFRSDAVRGPLVAVFYRGHW